MNVSIALLDASHLHHRPATNWLAAPLDRGWASCPLTQNGCIRMLSNPGYPNAGPAARVVERPAEAARHSAHAFWPDAIRLLEPNRLAWERLLSSRQVTDTHLLALVVERGGRAITLDRKAPLAVARGPSIWSCGRKPGAKRK